MKRFILGLAALLALCSLHPAGAQTVQAVTVTACGTPPNSPVAGNPYPLTMDTTGKLCDGASAPGAPGYAATDLGEVLITPVAATSPTIPSTATYCTFQAQNGTIDVRGDGTAATTSTGTQIYPGGTLSANGRAYAVGLSFIQQAGVGTIWQACYK